MIDTGIDTAFDFRSDSNGKDPDAASPTLRRYHRHLWSKTLPGGAAFGLSHSKEKKCHLYHHSNLGEFFLASDSVIATFDYVKSDSLSIPKEEMDAFNTISFTIGGMMVFPGKQIDRKMTINGARGCHAKIRDRFDLTLECIRRYYANEASPLTEVFKRYSNFFSLFEDFEGYVEFFLLQDLLIENTLEVKISGPFDNFQSCPMPKDVDQWRIYRDGQVAFINARNSRIRAVTNAANIPISS